MTDIRILGLDDDNHSPMFVSEDGCIYLDNQDLIALLSKPHENHYEVKMFALVDEWSTALLEYDECEVNNMFDFLCGNVHHNDNMTFDKIFELFWNSANRRYW